MKNNIRVISAIRGSILILIGPSLAVIAVRQRRIATKLKLRSHTFRLSTLFLLTALVATVLWYLTPTAEDRRSEIQLIGTWEVRLTESRSATTETRLIQHRENDLVDTLGRAARKHLAPVAKSHYWCVRNGMLIEGWQHATPREMEYKITWRDDDNFVLEFIGLDGSWVKTYNRRINSQ